METTLHLKTTHAFQQRSDNNTDVIIEKFIESCKKLDASIFEPFMNEENVFEDKDKYKFLAALKNRLEYYRSSLQLQFHVTHQTTKCLGCSIGKRVERFKARSLSSTEFFQFGYVIDVVEGQLHDIYECHYFEGMPEEPTPF